MHGAICYIKVCSRRKGCAIPKTGGSIIMSKQEEAGLILKLYELRREDTMRKARDWYFRDFNPVVSQRLLGSSCKYKSSYELAQV